ncbi:MAG TPA: hypothetical protein VL688_05045, partial [Verrucomicrobiae bacterium]|nr:hypothetical protein [Verrucomicrobiae bacterium]
MPKPDVQKDKDLSDVHFLQDMEQTQQPITKENAKSPDQIVENTPDTQPPANAYFSPEINPLQKRPGDQLQVHDMVDRIKFEYKKAGTSFTVDKATRRLLNMVDIDPATKKPVAHIMTYTLNGKDEVEKMKVQTITSRRKGFSQFKEYFVQPNGEIDGISNEGFAVNGREYKTREYDYDKWTMTAVNPLRPDEKTVFELDDNGEPGQMIQYEGVQDGKRLFLKYQYDKAHKRVTVLDALQGTRHVYAMTADGSLGDLEGVAYTDPQNHKYNVELSSYKDSNGAVHNTYIFRMADKPDQYRVFERAANGGIGDLLFINMDGEKKEYIRQKAGKEGEGDQLLVLDFKTMTYLRMKLLKPVIRWDGDLEPHQIQEAGTFIMKAATLKLTSTLVRKGTSYEIHTEDGYVLTYEALPNQEVGRIQMSRGPPDANGVSKTIEFTYELDPKTGGYARTAYYFPENTYRTTVYNPNTPDLQGVTIEEGKIRLAQDGSRIKEPSQKYLAKEVTPFAYDVKEATTFDYVYSLLEKGLPLAFVIDGLTSEDLEKLAALDFEVGVVVKGGKTIIFTSGTEEDVMVPAPVKELLDDSDVTFIAHNHPDKSQPSSVDFANAGKLKEYAIAGDQVWAYNKDGMDKQPLSLAGLASLIEKAQDTKPLSGPAEVLLHEALNRFIRGMDMLRDMEQTEFRKESPEEEEAYNEAEDELETRLGVNESNFTRQGIFNPATNIYELLLKYGQKYYRYSVNIQTDTATFLQMEDRSGAVPFFSGSTDLTANPKTTLPNLPSAIHSQNITMDGSYSPGIKYVYDVRANAEAQGKMRLENIGGNMNIGNALTLHAKVAPNGPALSMPFKQRVVLEDKNGRTVSVDLDLTTTLKAFTIDPKSIDPLFDKANVKRITFVHDQSVSGSNKRADVFVLVNGLNEDLTAVPGGTKGGAPSTLTNRPRVSLTGSFITARSKTNGFSYVYDARSSSASQPVAVIENPAGTMDAGSSFKLWLQAVQPTEDPVTLTYPVNAVIRFTDNSGSVIAKNVSITGTEQEFVFDLSSGIDASKIKKIEIIHNQAVSGDNQRAQINVGLLGLEKDASVLAPQATDSAPDNIGNSPMTYPTGRYITLRPMTDGVAYQYDLRRHPGDEAVMILKNKTAPISVDGSFEFWARADKADTGDRPAITEPLSVQVKVIDTDGKIAVGVVRLTSTMQKFELDTSGLNVNSIREIQFISNPFISENNTRAKIEVRVDGIQGRTPAPLAPDYNPANPQETEAFDLAMDDLETRLGIPKSNFHRVALTNTAANIYEVTLRHDTDYFNYLVDISSNIATLQQKEEKDDQDLTLRLTDLVENKVYNYEYDYENNEVTVVNETDSDYRVFEFDIDKKKKGKLIESGDINAQGEFDMPTLYDYTIPGEVTAINDDGTFQVYAFDAGDNSMGDLLREGTHDAGGDFVVTATYDYSIADIVTALHKDNTYSKYEYNAAQKKFGKLLEDGTQQNGLNFVKTTDYDYTVTGKVTAFHTDGTFETYDYNAGQNKIEKVLFGGTHDHGANLVTDRNYDYSVSGKVKVVYTNNTFEEYDYNAGQNVIGKAVDGGTHTNGTNFVTTHNYDYTTYPDQQLVVSNDNTYELYDYDTSKNKRGKLRESGVHDAGINFVANRTYDYTTTGQVKAVATDNTYTTYAFNDASNQFGNILETGTHTNGTNFETAKTYDYRDAGFVRIVDATSKDYVEYEFDSATRDIKNPVRGGYMNSINVAVVERDFEIDTPTTMRVTERADQSFVVQEYDPATHALGKILYGGQMDGVNPVIKTDYNYDIAGRVRIVNRDDNSYIERDFTGATNTIGKIRFTGTWDGIAAPVVLATYDYTDPTKVDIRNADDTYNIFEYDDTKDKLGRLLESGHWEGPARIIEKQFSYPDFFTRVVIDKVRDTVSTFNIFDELVEFTNNKTGETTFLTGGLIDRIEDSGGNVIRDYTYTGNPPSDADFTGKPASTVVTQTVDGRLSREIYEAGVTENNITTSKGPDFLVTDGQGPIEIVNQEDGKTAIYFNTGTIFRFKDDPSGGAREVMDEVINIKGRRTRSIYTADDLPVGHPFRAYADANAADMDLSVILGPEPDNDIIGAIVYQHDAAGLSQGPPGSPFVDFVLEHDGTVRYYYYNENGDPTDVDHVVERRSHVEPNRDAPIMSEIFYQDAGDHIDYILTYSADSSKVVQRSEYKYDDADPPDPDRVLQYDVSRESDPHTGGVLESTLTYKMSPFNDTEELRIKDITDKHGNKSTYFYRPDNFIDHVVQENAAGIQTGRIDYEQGQFYNDRVKRSVSYVDDPGSATPTDVLADEQTVYTYGDDGKVSMIQKFKVVGTLDDATYVNGAPVVTGGKLTDDQQIGITLFENEIPQAEFSFKWVDDDGTPATPDVQIMAGFTVLNYESDGRTANYSDQYTVTGAADVTPALIQAKIDENPADAIDTIKEAIDALLADAGSDDQFRTRVYFNDVGTRAIYSISMNKNEEPVSLSVFNYDDAGDGDLASIDQWDISEDGITLPTDASGVTVPSALKQKKSTVYFSEDGDRTEYVHNYRWDGAALKVASYNIFNYDADNKNLLKFTDSYFVDGGAPDIDAAAIQAKIDENPADSIDTIHEAIQAILAGTIDDDITGRTFLDKDQSPVLALSINAAKEISGFSTFEKNLDGTLKYVNAHRLVDQNTGTPGLQRIDWNARAAANKDEISDFTASDYMANLDTGLNSRTYMDTDGNPSVSVSINANNEVSGISTFSTSKRGDIQYVNSHRLIDQSTTDSSMTRGTWSSAAFDSLAKITASGLYETSLATGLTGRTFMDANGSPSVSMAINAQNMISGVSTFNVNPRGDINFVNSHRLIDQSTTDSGMTRMGWNPSSFDTLAEAQAPGLYETSLATGLTGRTFLDANGNPSVSVAINTNNQIAGISTFNVKDSGDINFVNSHRLIDQSTTDSGMTRANWSDTAYDTLAEIQAPGLYETSLTTGLTGRTFLDANGNPAVSMSINAQNQIAGVSTFKVKPTGDIDYVNSHRLIDQSTTDAGMTRRSWSDTGFDTLTEAQAAGLYETDLSTGLTGRTFLDANGNPSVSIAINAQNEITGASTFDVRPSGDIAFVNSHRLIDQSSTDSGMTRRSWTDAAFDTLAEAQAPGLYETDKDTGLTGRTFLDANGNPALSLAINSNNQISGVSTFSVKENGEIEYVNSHRMIDQSTTDSGMTRAGWSSAAFDTLAEAQGAGLYETSLATGLTGRTFLDANGNPSVSLAINANNQISGVSTFSVKQNGDIEYVNSHRLIDQSTTDSGMTRVSWNPSSFDTLAEAQAPGLYETDLATGLTGRTFLDANGNPAVSIAINSNNEISGVSTFSVKPSGDIDYVNSHRLIDQSTTDSGMTRMSWNPSSFDTLAEAQAPGLYDTNKDTGLTGRTFLDANGNPSVSIAINSNNQISGVSTFSVKPTGDIEFVNSHRLIDQSTTDSGMTRAAWSSSAYDTLGEAQAGGLYETSLTTGLTGRTFLDANGNPAVSVAINSNNEISGVSTFQVKASGDIEFVNSHRLIDQNTTDTGMTRKAWNPSSYDTLAEAQAAGLYETDVDTGLTGRTFLDANGNPSLSFAINANNEISGASSFSVRPNGDIAFVNSHRLIDQTTTDSGMTRVSWSSAAFDTLAEAQGAGVFETSLATGLTGRTFLDANGNPSVSIAINSANQISGVSTFSVKPSGDIEFVNSHRLIDQSTTDAGMTRLNWNPSSFDTLAEAQAPGLYETDLATGLTGRTFLDASGNPAVSLAINTNNQISGVSTFSVKPSGDIAFVNSHRMIDQSTTDAGMTRMNWSPSSFDTLAEAQAAGLYETDVNTGLTGRTFLDANGNPAVSLAINANNQVSGVSTFSTKPSGDIEYVNSHRLVDQTTTDSGMTRAAWSSAAFDTLAEAQSSSLYETSVATGLTGRTFLDANGNPALSVAINSLNQISGISTFSVKASG